MMVSELQNEENTPKILLDGCPDLASVVQRLDSAIHRNLYPVDSAISFPNTYPLDGDLSGG